MWMPVKLFLGARAIVKITIDPTDLEQVFALADLAEDSPQLERLLNELRKHPALVDALERRPRLGPVDLDALAKLPAGTIGRSYADYMRARGLQHEDLVLVTGEREIDYVRNHLRETHDLWHVATGFDTDVAGELGVQAFYLAQFNGPLGLLLIAIGLMNAVFKDIGDSDRRMNAIARGWLLGRRAETLFGLDWKARWSQPLAELRREFSIDVARVDEVLAESGAEVLARAA